MKYIGAGVCCRVFYVLIVLLSQAYSNISSDIDISILIAARLEMKG